MRNEYAHWRLTMWALWWARNRGGAGNFARASMDERVDNDKRVGWDAPTVIGNLDAEAEETEQAVAALADDARKAVRVYYIDSGNAAKKAARLGISPSTLYLRVEQATHAVSRWLDDRRRAGNVERLRVEALQRQAAAAHADVRSASLGDFERQPAAQPRHASRDSTGSVLAAHLAARRLARKTASG